MYPILAGIVHMTDDIPLQVVPLIKHMLTVDPQKRATCTEILNDPWFRTGLPSYLFAPVTLKLTGAAVDGLAIDQASEVKKISRRITEINHLVLKPIQKITLFYLMEDVELCRRSVKKRLPTFKNSIE